MKRTTISIGFGLVLFLSGAFGGLPTAAEASTIAYPNMGYQYPQQYDYWQMQYPQNYTTNAGYYTTYQTYDPYYYNYNYNYTNTANCVTGRDYLYPGEQLCDSTNYNYYNNYSYNYDYNYQQQLAQYQYQLQLAQYYAQLESNNYYNNVVYQGGYPYYVPACSYDDRVHSTCHQYQFTAELMGANNDITCQIYGQCWSYGNGWPYRY